MTLIKGISHFLVASVVALVFSTVGCAELHHVQLGDIDNRDAEVGIPFEVLMSETGVSTEEINGIARAASRGGHNAVSDIAAIVSLFQMGPRTGNPVYSEHYSEKMVYEIYQKCPTGHISDLMFIRETRKYPVISGEIVKVTGMCLHAKTTARLSKNQGAL